MSTFLYRFELAIAYKTRHGVLNTGNIYASLQPSQAAWDMTEALILALNQEVAERGGQLVVAILPDETEVPPPGERRAQ